MAFRANAGRIWVTDAADSATIFDSDEPLFSGEYVSGQVTTPARSASYIGSGGTFSNIDIDVNHVLASCNSAYDTVVGGFKLSTSPSDGVTGIGWFNANGTYVHNFMPVSSTYAKDGTNWNLGGFAAYTFIASGGQLILNERVFWTVDPTNTLFTITNTLSSVVFDFKLYVGKFL